MDIKKRVCSKFVFPALFLAGAMTVNGQNSNDLLTQRVPVASIKTNLLYDATASINLGLEFRLGRKSSFELSGNWNPFTFQEGTKWKHYLIQPELRLWTKETFSRHFFGLHGHYALFNVGMLPMPFSTTMQENRFQGWLAGAGLSYGYRLNFNRRWGLEATIGGGYAYLEYDKYTCNPCSELLGKETKHYLGPTKVGLSLILNIGSKTVSGTKAPTVIQDKAAIVSVYEPHFTVSFTVPEVEKVKRRGDSGRAYLDFASGRSEIISSYKGNSAELQKIHTLIEEIKNNPDATVTGITITGYASPEGTYDSNLALSLRRANNLKDQIMALQSFPERLFTVNGEGEDWALLDTLVSKSSMPDKYMILEIIRGTGIFDGREKKLMELSGGNPYRVLFSTMFPQLRRLEYEIHYTVSPFSVEKGKEVFRTNPSSLSLNEMYLIANTYEPGSDDFNNIFDTAVKLFPHNDTANLNGAASALGRKDTVSAARYLERVRNRNAAFWNNAGILAFLEGEMQEARECFTKSLNESGVEAARNLEELNKYKNIKQH